MNAKITNIKEFKSLINSLIKLISKNSISDFERCIELKVKDNTLFLTGLSTSSHQISLSTPISNGVDGVCYLFAEILNQVIKIVPASKKELYLSSSADSLSILINGLGEIKEGLFHNQEAFEGIIVQEEIDINIPGIIPLIINASKLVDASSYILLRIKRGVIYVIGNLSVSNQVIYEFPFLDNEIEKDVYIKAGPIKSLDSSIPADAAVGIGEHYIHIYNREFDFKIKYLDTHTDLALFNIQSHLLETEYSDEVTSISLLDIIGAITWQSYNYKTGDCITFSTFKTKGSLTRELNIKGDSMEESSSIEVKGNLDPIRIQIENVQIEKVFPKKTKSSLYIKTKCIQIEEGENIIVVFFEMEEDNYKITNLTYQAA